MKSFQYLAPIASFDYAAPSSIEELLDMLRIHGSRAKLVAGGTDLTIALKRRAIRPDMIIDLSSLRSAFAGVALKDGSLRIGSMTTFTDLERNPLVSRFARALSVAASQVGTFQIRNLGTLGGNLVNASPAADSAPPLIALGAEVRVLSIRGERVFPVDKFFSGVKQSVLAPDEFVSSVEFPARDGVSSYWMRFARRNENVISVVSVAVAAEVKDGRFGKSRVSLGAVAPTPILASRSSEALSGSEFGEATCEKVAAIARDESRPITDVRAGADFRRHLVYVLTKRTLRKVAEEAN
jgi:CO/xanthine dehydrogenase FAD-binding subunit